MSTKTISGHYGTAFSLKHNNRLLISKNVDPSRIKNNFNPIMAGMPVTDLYPDYLPLSQQWSEYRTLSDLYWGRVRAERAETVRLKWIEKQRSWRYQQALEALCDHGLLSLLLFPLVITLSVLDEIESQQLLSQYEGDLLLLKTEANRFRNYQADLRGALLSHDRQLGTKLLGAADHIIGLCDTLSDHLWGPPSRFATEAEVYEKVFEDSFQLFQAKQRKCRRFDGTYLEQIRQRAAAAQKKCTNPADRLRVMAEAIEVIFTIGDMDNTGYRTAPEDARKSEALLRDFCLHLLTDSHVCAITDRELRNPFWKPPFKHGLIVLNLVAHFDEATPGIHLTVIPYTSGCKRGPDKQPSMGRAFAGMGYATKWETCLDEQGRPIPKLNRYGDPIVDKDGQIRMQQEPKQQGILDWIEHQKEWLQNEMLHRYGWKREYKGQHPRGNLSTPDYQVARAKERLAAIEQEISAIIQEYITYVSQLTESFSSSLKTNLEASKLQTIMNYLSVCPPDRFEALFDEAYERTLTSHTVAKEKLKASLTDQIAAANAKKSSCALAQAPSKDHTINRNF